MKKYISSMVLILTAIPALALASGVGNNGEGGDVLGMMARLVLQLGAIVMIARMIGLMLQRVKLPIPSVLIEVLAGVIIGPHLLGSTPLPGFPDGLFPLVSAAAGIPVSLELYGIATIASIIILFTAGLETDLALLLKFSVVGLIVGLGGVILPFFTGTGAAVLFFDDVTDFMNPGALFLGVMCTATSVGITARILSERRKMDSPEGVTILAGAVIDDVLGIITLTVVTGLIAAETVGGGIGFTSDSAWIITRAVLVWLGFTAAGIIFAAPLSRFIKKFKSVTYISVFSLGLAFILAGIFEMAGLAMIIGAYVVGLSLSKTDLTDTVRDALEALQGFFAPVFFVVMGMLVDPRAFMSKEVLVFGAIYTAAAVVTKIIGCGAPALFLNFNKIGALRIGMGMVPRGEVALIIAGIGLSSGVIDQRFFGAGVMMALASSLVAPPFVALLFKSDAPGTKKEFKVRQTVLTPVELASHELANLLELRLARAFRAEGFFVHSIIIGARNVYHMRKNDTLITLHCGETCLEFESDAQDVMFIKAAVYETLTEINGVIANVKALIKPENMLKDLSTEMLTINQGFRHMLSRGSIIPFLKAKTKQETVEELTDILVSEGLIKNRAARDAAVKNIMEREASMSTGMQFGVALPHARTDAVDKVTLSVGLSRKGIDYESLDGEPSKIFVMILSPQSSECSHLQVLANVSAMLNSAEAREKLLRCSRQEDIYEFFDRGFGN